ncbi:hypothetical protein [Rhizobium leguminosarum]|uniref:hypothetical protein n=1 Tax=Rhizobium leguminosarum TaxID=384 RepID=UPI0013EF98BC|nr:hypothetical protein [Rhizobium leguminosarum]
MAEIACKPTISWRQEPSAHLKELTKDRPYRFIAEVRDDLRCDDFHTLSIFIVEVRVNQEFEDNLVAIPAARNSGYC